MLVGVRLNIGVSPVAKTRAEYSDRTPGLTFGITTAIIGVGGAWYWNNSPKSVPPATPQQHTSILERAPMQVSSGIGGFGKRTVALKCGN